MLAEIGLKRQWLSALGDDHIILRFVLSIEIVNYQLPASKIVAEFPVRPNHVIVSNRGC
jgi:hypothetical protein